MHTHVRNLLRPQTRLLMVVYEQARRSVICDRVSWDEAVVRTSWKSLGALAKVPEASVRGQIYKLEAAEYIRREPHKYSGTLDLWLMPDGRDAVREVAKWVADQCLATFVSIDG